jgi:outer membrane protein assembly factor BamA
MNLNSLKFQISIFLCFLVVIATGQETMVSAPDSIGGPNIYIRNISFTGNKVTKDKIINRELLIKTDDEISRNELPDLISKSHQNLMNTSLFNFVTFDTARIEGSDSMDVHVDFIERWYIWPVPIFEFADRNLSEWLRKMDWSRLNYGGILTWNNFRGRREKLLATAIFGYNQKLQLNYQIPFINKKQTLGLGFGIGYKRNHEIAFNSDNNKEIYFKTEDLFAKKEFYTQTEIFYRKSINNKHWGKISYSNIDVHDSVVILNPDYLFGEVSRNEFITVFYQFRSDFRDYQAYPLNGHYFDLEFEQKGFGIFGDPKVHSLLLRTNIRKYVNIKGRFYWSTGISLKTSPFWDQPYYYQQGLGYGRDYVRGYEYYVMDGQHYGLLKNNLKFALIPQQVIKFNFIPTDKFNTLPIAFYLNAHIDLGYSYDKRDYIYNPLGPPNFTNPLANELLVGYGVGIDFVSYYDFVFRLEYSVNKMGEGGFYIALRPPI